jgi:integrase
VFWLEDCEGLTISFVAMVKRKKTYKKAGLPPYVTLKAQKGKPRAPKEWHVRLTFGTTRRDAKGKIIYDQITRRCDPETAERAAEVVQFIRDEVESKRTRKPTGRQTLGDFLAYYLSVKQDSVTKRTYEFYSYLFEHHLKTHAIAKEALVDLKTLDLQTFFSNLAASPQRKRKVYVFMNMAFRQAITWELLVKNPAIGVVLPKFKPKESLAMSPAEARKFIEACRKDDRYIVFEFALETGLRPQETLAMRWQDVDLARRRISVKKAIAEGFVGGGFEVKDPKTESSKRTNGISVQLRDRLLRHKQLQDEYLDQIRDEFDAPLTTQKKTKGVNYAARKLRRQLAGEKLEDFRKYDLVFPATNGKPQAKGNLNRREFKEVLKLAGIDPKKYSFETLRHTCLTFLANHLHPKKLQKYAGHAEMSTTMKYYVHVDDESQFEGSDHMSAALY